jgi:hypothetical protein
MMIKLKFLNASYWKAISDKALEKYLSHYEVTKMFTSYRIWIFLNNKILQVLFDLKEVKIEKLDKRDCEQVSNG